MKTLISNMNLIKILGVICFLSNLMACEPVPLFPGTQPSFNATGQSPGEEIDDPRLSSILEAIKNDPENINKFTGPNGQTALHYAVLLQRIEPVETLLAIGADPNVANDLGLTPLHTAVQLNNLTIVDILLQHKQTKVNKPDSKTWTALHHAADKGYEEIVERLLKHPDINVNQPTQISLNGSTENNMTALHIAARHGYDKIVEFLLKHPDINLNSISTVCDRTPLDEALHMGHLRIAYLLLQHPGITIGTRTRNLIPMTFFQAGEEGHAEIIQLLLKHLESGTQNELPMAFMKETVFIKAALAGHFEIVNLLLKHLESGKKNELIPRAFMKAELRKVT